MCRKQVNKLAWLEKHLTNSSFKPLYHEDTKLGASELALIHYRYQEIESHPAYLDLMHKLIKMRDDVRLNIERGTLDNHGNNHDDESRAVLYCLNSFLDHPHAYHRDFEKLAKTVEKQKEELVKCFSNHASLFTCLRHI